jgi:hypothetical protein
MFDNTIQKSVTGARFYVHVSGKWVIKKEKQVTQHGKTVIVTRGYDNAHENSVNGKQNPVNQDAMQQHGFSGNVHQNGSQDNLQEKNVNAQTIYGNGKRMQGNQLFTPDNRHHFYGNGNSMTVHQKAM